MNKFIWFFIMKIVIGEKKRGRQTLQLIKENEFGSIDLNNF